MKIKLQLGYVSMTKQINTFFNNIESIYTDVHNTTIYDAATQTRTGCSQNTGKLWGVVGSILNKNNDLPITDHVKYC